MVWKWGDWEGILSMTERYPVRLFQGRGYNVVVRWPVKKDPPLTVLWGQVTPTKRVLGGKDYDLQDMFKLVEMMSRELVYTVFKDGVQLHTDYASSLKTLLPHYEYHPYGQIYVRRGVTYWRTGSRVTRSFEGKCRTCGGYVWQGDEVERTLARLMGRPTEWYMDPRVVAVVAASNEDNYWWVAHPGVEPDELSKHLNKCRACGGDGRRTYGGNPLPEGEPITQDMFIDKKTQKPVHDMRSWPTIARRIKNLREAIHGRR